MLVIPALLADVFFLPRGLAAWVGLGFGYSRMVVSGLLLAPLGFVNGNAVSHGLARAGRRGSVDGSPAGRQRSNNAVEWAWAMNAAASVLGSVLAMVIAIQFGLNATLACGVAAYLLALLLLPSPAPTTGIGRALFLL